jgi:cobalamin biosynthesis protein CobW
MSKIPVTVITGFLGSGKTTLIRHLLTHAHGKRIVMCWWAAPTRPAALMT